MIRNLISRQNLIKLTSLHRRCSNRTTPANGPVADMKETQEQEECQEETVETFKLPPEPENCCMSGCQNCVWIQYAQDLTDLYMDSGETAKQVILEKIKDPSMQVFIKMELSAILNDKK